MRSSGHMALVAVLTVAFQSSEVTGSWTCNATLWKETVEPLLAIYLAAVDGLPYLLKSLDRGNDHLSQIYPNGGSTTLKEFLDNGSADLCDFLVDGDPPNLHYLCTPANNTIDPDLGICKCLGIWQKNVIDHSGKCVAAPGSKCRRIPSILRQFSGWLNCYPGSVCKEDQEEAQLLLGDAKFEYAYGYCRCLNPADRTCEQLRQFYDPYKGIGGCGITLAHLQLIMAFFLSVYLIL